MRAQVDKSLQGLLFLLAVLSACSAPMEAGEVGPTDEANGATGAVDAPDAADGAEGLKPESQEPSVDSRTADESAPTRVDDSYPRGNLLENARASIRNLLAAQAPAVVTEELVGTEFEEFLDTVTAIPSGGFSIDDMSFRTMESLTAYFLDGMGEGRVEKGIYLNTGVWGKTSFKACFTPDSTSTTTQRNRVESLIQQTWVGATGITIQFRDSNGVLNVCSQADTTTYDFKIYHAKSTDTLPISRGCASVGSFQAGNDGVNCLVPGTSHPWASMALPANGNVGWQEQTAIHEFGHALDLQHEGRRTDATTGCNVGDFQLQDANDTTVGTFDINSVMSYCASQFPLITTGDITTIQTVFGLVGKPKNFGLRTNWPSGRPAFQVQLTMVHNGVSSVATIPSAAGTFGGTSGFFGGPGAGEPYSITVTSTPPADTKCTVSAPVSAFVRDVPQVIPPEGMPSTNPINLTCYQPSLFVPVFVDML